MCIKVTTVAYASLVKYFKNATIRAYAGLRVTTFKGYTVTIYVYYYYTYM